MNSLKSRVLTFYNSIEHVKDHRYISWEHCHSLFSKLNKKEIISDKDKELAQLHLAFFLASWGMYRGSSFLLQKDYTVFSGIIKIIFKKEYAILWDIENNSKDEDLLLKRFIEIYGEIKDELKTIKKTIQKHSDLPLQKRKSMDNEHLSDTLITKILMGTIGCTPAYDRYFKEGLSNQKVIQKEFRPEKSFNQLIKFYKTNKEEINELLIKMSGYTPMKLIDMNFWIIGDEIEKRKNE